MEIIHTVFGQGENLNSLQMCARAVVIFLLALIYIRIAGTRAFGGLAAFDYIITITLGALLSRAIVGASPFVPILASSLTIVLLHRTVAWLCVHSHFLGKLVKGSPVTVFKNGKFNRKAMSLHQISERDAMEGVRMRVNQHSTDQIDEIILERNGELSVITSREADE